ncbi:Adenosine receptor A2b [Holothuria leucospilota]|uniref:Adenosine receptor A2b n=1 Tax=Holothuria leucospilota TaxID=206669 RepID=A0A9Q1CHJ3_HOLLE|nr:Adenosine receptor A2b [Holothuria leucospilota]
MLKHFGLEMNANTTNMILPTEETMTGITEGIITDTPEELIGFSYILCSVLIVTAFTAFVGNFLVIAVILRSSKLNSVTWGLLLNLAVSDILSAGLLQPLLIIIQTLPNRNVIQPKPWLCSLTGCVFEVLMEISIWTLSFLSIERYFAVKQPLHYHQRVTKQRAVKIVCTLWVSAICWGCLPFVFSTGYKFNPSYQMCLPQLGIAATLTFTAVGILLPFVLLCCMYISIGKIAFTQAQRKVVQCTADNCTYVSPKQKDYRAVKILAILAGVFATCWLPFNIFTVIDLFVSESLLPSLYQISLSLTLMNAAINPWLYAVLNKTFRIAAGKQFRKLWGQGFCHFDDNKVCPPPGENKRVLKTRICGDHNVLSTHFGGPKLQQRDLHHTKIIKLPHQLSEPRLTLTSTSSVLHKPCLASMNRNKTI